MAMTQKERDDKSTLKRKAVGEIELRHAVRAPIKSMLFELMRWHGIEEVSEAIQLLILNAEPAQAPSLADADVALEPKTVIRHYARLGLVGALDRIAAEMHGASQKHCIELLVICAHSVGPIESAKYLRVPRHEIAISANVAREFHNPSLREIQRNPGDEVVIPA